MIRNRFGAMLFGVALLALVSACGQSAVSTSPAASPTASPAGERIPVLAASELAVGVNRLPFGLLEGGAPVNDPELQLGLRFFFLDGAEPTKVLGESVAVYRGEGLPFGLYVTYVDFPQPGAWGVEIITPQASGPPSATRLRLDVQAETRIPAPGDPAIPSRNLTARDVPDLSRLTSDPSPDPDFYQLTIAEAIAAKKPFVVAFATPSYCQTAVCTPNMQVLKRLKAQYQDRINFIHVEVYPYPFGESFRAQRYVPQMAEWGLRTEPWTFLVDAQGVIQARYEGGVTFAELEPALAQLAAGEPVHPPMVSAGP